MDGVPNGSKGKLLHDPIHGTIEVPHYCVEIIDTPQFQRLRSLKQLGVTSYVFPGATHTRFEHSVGVSHLARQSIRRFQRCEPHLAISDREVQLVTVAALCHDLGHGPFSHAFEGWIRRKVPGWEHEDKSIELFKSIVASGRLSYQYTDEDVRMITDMIHGIKPDDAGGKIIHRGFLYEIVANKRNNIDVDKFDYLARDSYHCGQPVAVYERLLLKRRVLQNQICYSSKEAYTLSELFRKRFSMFRTVYCHEVGIAIEHMLRDILSLADDALKICERAQNLEDYMYLTDAILNEIECSKAPNIGPAQRLLKRLRCRDLYKTVGKAVIQDEDVARFKQELAQDVHRKDMIAFCSPDAGITEDDVDVALQQMNYGQGFDDPIKSTRFYRSQSKDEVPFVMTDRDISVLHPVTFSENVIICISKTPASEKAKAKAISKGWNRYFNTVIKDVYQGARTENSPQLQRSMSLNNTPASTIKQSSPKGKPLAEGFSGLSPAAKKTKIGQPDFDK